MADMQVPASTAPTGQPANTTGEARISLPRAASGVRRRRVIEIEDDSEVEGEDPLALLPGPQSGQGSAVSSQEQKRIKGEFPFGRHQGNLSADVYQRIRQAGHRARPLVPKQLCRVSSFGVRSVTNKGNS